MPIVSALAWQLDSLNHRLLGFNRLVDFLSVLHPSIPDGFG
ncbi:MULTISPECIES: hypothetical protein [Candidatus Hamiltonella]|nr:hypothetical protein [Candidatus Hamiltonella defensa]